MLRPFVLSAFEGEFFGLGASLGRARRVTAQVTFDRARAAQGGLIYAAPIFGPADAEAIRLSEGILATSGGRLSLGARVAREHQVAAVILGSGRWSEEDGRPVLILEAPIFGAQKFAAGVAYQLATGAAPLYVREGDVISLEPERGVARFYPASEQAGRLALASAMNAYDGLKDGAALLHWLADEKESGTLKAVAPWTIEEMSGRVAEGGVPAADLTQVLKVVSPELSAAGLKAARKAAWEGELRRVIRFLRAQEEEAKRAVSAAAAARVLDRSETRWKNLRALAETLSERGELSAAEPILRAVRAAAAGKKNQTAKDSDWARVAASAGAGAWPRVAVPPSFYKEFMSGANLGAKIEDISSDASIDLRRKSARIRALFEGARPNADFSAKIQALVPASWQEVALLSPDARRRVARPKLEETLRSAWADLWAPGALGARKRAGRSLTDGEQTVYIEEAAPAEASGLALTGGPRLEISAAAGDLDALLAGAAPADEYEVNAEAGVEALPAVVAGKSRVLSPEQVARVARMAAALSDHFGGSLEIRFFYKERALYVSQVFPLSALAGD